MYNPTFIRSSGGQWCVKVPWLREDFEKSAQLDLDAYYFPREEGSTCCVHKRDGTATTVRLGRPLETVNSLEPFAAFTVYTIKER